MYLSGIRTIGGEKLPLLPPWKNIKIRAKNIKSKKLLGEKKRLPTIRGKIPPLITPRKAKTKRQKVENNSEGKPLCCHS